MNAKPLSAEHRMRIGATRIGISLADYRAFVEAGMKWCCACRVFHRRELFATRRATPDGLDNACREVVNARAREYQRKRRQAERRAG